MSEPIPSVSRVAELEARQDEILRQLDDLERQIEAVLRQHCPVPTIPINLAVAVASPVIR